MKSLPYLNQRVNQRRTILAAALAGTLTVTCLPHSALAQAWPSKPVKLLVPLAVMAGEVAMGFFNTPTVINQIREGKLKALAVTSLTRSPLLPNLAAQSFEVAPPASPAAFGKLIADDLAKWIPIVKRSGAKVD